MSAPPAQADEWDEIDRQAKRRASEKGRDGVSSSFARFRVDPITSSYAFHSRARKRAHEMPRGGESS
jgi:hypothetical protein